MDKKPREVFQAALTCRAPRSKSFFGTEPKPTALSLGKEPEGLDKKEEEEGWGWNLRCRSASVRSSWQSRR